MGWGVVWKGFVAGPGYGAGRLPVGTIDLVAALELASGQPMTETG